MDLKKLNGWIDHIQAKNVKNNVVEVINHSPFKMIGKGRQGAVFKVNMGLCVKVFGNVKDCENEYFALSLGQKSNLFPRVYTKGEQYIAMELVSGVDLRKYLQSHPLTMVLSAKLLKMLITFKEIGFSRIDHHKKHIFIQADGNLKVIDVGKSVGCNEIYPYPRRLLSSLGHKNTDIFLSHVKVLEPEMYDEWMYYIRMEELSRGIYHLLMKQSGDDKTYLSLQIVQQVFEEEWAKVMLAKGYKAEEIIEEIKE